MNKPRASLFALLLAFAPALWADTIKVTTFADENDAQATSGGHCSLREAIAYMTLPLTPIKDDDGNIPAGSPNPPYRSDGWGGCKLAEGTSENSADVIELPAEIDGVRGTYQLTHGALQVKTSMSINGQEADRRKFPVIKAVSGNRVFLIDDGVVPVAGETISSYYTKRITVTLSQMTLEGNGQVTDGCVTVSGTPTSGGCGGLILVNGENLIMATLILKNGDASEAGGAIYVAHAGRLNITGSEFNSNQAKDGAVLMMSADNVVASSSTDPNTHVTTTIYAKNALALASSLIASDLQGSQNKALSVGGAMIAFRGDVTAPTKPELDTGSKISISTISGNAGVAIKAAKGLTVVQSTIIGNMGGIDFLGTDWGMPDLVDVFNTILADNAGQDCKNTLPTAADPSATAVDALKVSIVQYNLFGNQSQVECSKLYLAATPTVPNGNAYVASSVLMASAQVCDARVGDNTGLLCPLADNGGLTRTHRPRLPVTGNNISADFNASKIVFRGAAEICTGEDQRGKAMSPGRCDIGSVQLQFENAYKPVAKSVGGAPAILPDVEERDLNGQITKAGYITGLGDVELLPASECGDLGVVANPADPTEEVVDGCMLFRSGRLVMLDSAKKGYVERIPNSRELRYVPNNYFHGTDRFSFRIATTLSRFGDGTLSPGARFATISVRIDGEPSSGASSKSSDVAGALSLRDALCMFAVMGLLASLRRRMKQI